MRFLNYLIYDFNFYRKEKIVFASVIFFALIAQAVCAQVGGVVGGFLTTITFPLLLLFISLGSIYMASHFGVAFRKKQTSIMFLSFPVSTTEKFCARFINQLIVPALIVVLVHAVVLALLALVNNVYPLKIWEGISIVYGQMKEQKEFIEPYMSLISLMSDLVAVSMFSSLCLMMLGSLIFGRYAVVKSIVSYTILSWLISPFLVDNEAMYAKAAMLHASNPDPAALYDFFQQLFSERMFLWYGLEIAVSIIISYILFKRKTVIKPGF